jgi:type III pantothenate kinase
VTWLLVDLGNTRVKLARARGDQITDVCSVSTTDGEAFAGHVTRLLESGMGALVASVAGAEATAAAVARIEQRVDGPVRQIRAVDPVPLVTNGYRKPDQLGVDRLLAMVAARSRVTAPVCVVDAGTAVTMDLVDAAGQHLGGFILPGLRMMRDSLLAGTAIPADAEIQPGTELGRDTATAVALGSRYAIAGLVERFTARAEPQMRIVLGGGDASELIGFLPPGCITLDHLVLRGLAVVAASGSQ